MDYEEEEYESDPEQAKLSLKMRRRQASDDEDEEEEVHASGGRERRIDYRVSDCESDEQGAPAEYDDEESDLEEELLEEVEEEFGKHCGGRDNAQGLETQALRKDFVDGVVDQIGENVSESVEGQGQEEKKENDPFVVPTAGAFYMHDDRFRDSVGGRHRRTLGEKKLWESRDDKKWGHDKFEEMSLQERNYKEGRRGSRGRNQVHGRNKGQDHEYSQENRPKAPRGKGPRRYRPASRNNTEAPANNRGPLKSLDKASHANTVATSTSESAQFPPTKNGLNFASPPFYPSGSSNKEIKRDAVNRNIHPPVSREAYPVSQSNNKPGKNVFDSLSMDKLYIDDSINSSRQPLQTRNKGRGQTPLGRMTYQPVPPHNQANRAPLPEQVHAFQPTPVHVSSPPKVSSPTTLFESTTLASPLEPNNIKMELVGKGKGDIRNNGMSSFPYGGTQLMATSGSIGGNYGYQNFTGSPTFLPVMQFAGQHRGGIGVPAVGMAFPGYVGQPNGMGKSEMTWLPVLAGAAGSLGAYHAWTAGQTSSLAPALSKDSIINEPDNSVKPYQKSEVSNIELGQRQNKARRYTEMKFGQ